MATSVMKVSARSEHNIIIRLKAIAAPPNYISSPFLVRLFGNDGPIEPEASADPDYEFEWSVDYGSGAHRLVLAVASDLIPDLEHTDLNYQVEVSQNNVALEPRGNTKNPKTSKAVFRADGSGAKEQMFYISVYASGQK